MKNFYPYNQLTIYISQFSFNLFLNLLLNFSRSNAKQMNKENNCQIYTLCLVNDNKIIQIPYVYPYEDKFINEELKKVYTILKNSKSNCVVIYLTK